MMDGNAWGALAFVAVAVLLWRLEPIQRLADRLDENKLIADGQRAQDRIDLECMRLINALRDSEGWYVELVCDNPDFEGPGCTMGLYGEWHIPGDFAAEGGWEWKIRNFSGNTLLACLHSATAAVGANGRIT